MFQIEGKHSLSVRAIRSFSHTAKFGQGELSEFLLSSYGGKFANILSPISKREKAIPGTHSLRKKGKEIKAWTTARISQKIPFCLRLRRSRQRGLSLKGLHKGKRRANVCRGGGGETFNPLQRRFPTKKRTTTDRLRVLLFFAGKRSIVP